MGPPSQSRAASAISASLMRTIRAQIEAPRPGWMVLRTHGDALGFAERYWSGAATIATDPPPGAPRSSVMPPSAITPGALPATAAR